MKKLAILVSGSGSNMQALVEAMREQPWGQNLHLAGVIVDRPEAAAIGRAQALNLPCELVNFRGFALRADFEAAVLALLNRWGVDLVLLAGFMRILSPSFLAALPGQGDRIMNIHPSLLPAFPGLQTHVRALEAGVKIHGATVHWVRPELDHGPILGQAALRTRPGETAEALAKRVLALEHRLFPAVLQAWAQGHLSGPSPANEPPLIWEESNEKAA
jgi:phosphoribosylglycinamide formyltransferase 1